MGWRVGWPQVECGAGDFSARYCTVDMKAKRAGLPLSKLLGSHRDSVQCYNTSGGFLHTPLDQVLKMS
ncbi:hypothetical protein [Pectobacterium parvum]|uniref:hypothetical protein n=1 Tax=Pectobacterium parvum TaxID=2778550 RepID=UPI00315AAC6D